MLNDPFKITQKHVLNLTHRPVRKIQERQCNRVSRPLLFIRNRHALTFNAVFSFNSMFYSVTVYSSIQIRIGIIKLF